MHQVTRNADYHLSYHRKTCAARSMAKTEGGRIMCKDVSGMTPVIVTTCSTRVAASLKEAMVYYCIA